MHLSLAPDFDKQMEAELAGPWRERGHRGPGARLPADSMGEALGLMCRLLGLYEENAEVAIREASGLQHL